MKPIYKLTVGIIFSALPVAVFIALIFLMFGQTQDADTWRSHTFVVMEASEKFMSVLKDAETGQRGYLLTGNKDYLAPHLNSQVSIANVLAELRRLTQDNPAQQHRLDGLTPLVNSKLEELSQTLALYQHGQRTEALEIVNRNLGKSTMDRIRAMMDEFNAMEKSLLA